MGTPLKILMLCPRYLWAGGGSVDHASRLCGEMSEALRKCDVIGMVTISVPIFG